MTNIKLIYFEGCPNAKDARALLLGSMLDFEVIKQDDLSKNHPMLEYSSPSILQGEKIIYGYKIAPGSSACSAEKLNEELIRSKLNGLSIKQKTSFFASTGSFGAAFTVGLCPVCIPAIGAFLSSIGLGFLVTESFLHPLLIVFLALNFLGLFWSALREHGNYIPLLLGTFSGVSLYVGRYIYINGPVNMSLMYGGIFAIIGVSLWNLKLRKSAKCPACVS